MNKKRRQWIEGFARFGYTAKGVVYFTVGLLAAFAAWSGSRPEGNEGALRAILEQPFGRPLLAIVAFGLLGYSCWRFVQARYDTEGKGTKARGILQRLGYGASGLIHLGLAFACAKTVVYKIPSGDEQSQGFAETLLQQPFGKALVALVGVCLIGVALYRLYTVWSLSFKNNFRLWKMSPEERKFAINSGRLGIAARSVVFCLTGYFFLRASSEANPAQAGALKKSLLWVEQMGTWYLAVLAFGLIAYATYQMFLARYREINTAAV